MPNSGVRARAYTHIIFFVTVRNHRHDGAEPKHLLDDLVDVWKRIAVFDDGEPVDAYHRVELPLRLLLHFRVMHHHQEERVHRGGGLHVAAKGVIFGRVRTHTQGGYIKSEAGYAPIFLA